MTQETKPRPTGVGIVWREGRPVIEEDWVRHLKPEQRAWVDGALRERGFRLNGFVLEEIE